MMQIILNLFENNIESVRELDSIHTLIKDKFPLLQDRADEILRAEVVLLVSALDCFIHDVVRIKMIEIFQGRDNSNKKFDNFLIRSKSLLNIINAEDDIEKAGIFENEVRELNSKNSFQSPSSIEYALNMIAITNLWNKLEPYMNIKAEDIKRTLSLIIQRRNKIAHEADINEMTMFKNPIDKHDLEFIMEFIVKFCEGINNVVNKPS